MSSCKKRAADAAAAADATIAAFGDSKRPRTSSRPTFLFCKPNQQVVEVLSRIGRVCTFTDFKTWPNSMPNNIKKLQAAAINASQDGPVVLVGSSFGCRIVAGLLKTRGAAWRNSAVMVSYPLYGDNARSDRVAALREVNADAALLFHSGSRDEYLDRRGWRGQDVPTGRAALEAVVSCNATYSIVDGVGHSSCGSRRAKDQLQAAIEKLLRDDDAAPAAPAAPSATDREAERAARLRFFEPRGAAAPSAAPAPATAPPMAPAAPAPPPSIKEMKETIRKAGLATADLLERPHVEERYKKALARLAKVVDLTCDE
jgi:pimeloyl-ACP methyl ester carboxylesterase